MGVAVGIDLGTSNSCVAAMVDGVPTVLADAAGRRTQPSVVAFGYGGSVVVGHRARAQMAYAPETTVHSVKRLIGRRYKTIEVEHVKQHVAWGIVEGPKADARVRVQGKLYAAQEISAHVLSHMKKVAEEALNKPVTHAVITVPAYFNDQQRQATRDAATLAGLDCLRILNEPTAAAVAYGYGQGHRQHVAVYDLGGGTFDISILRIDKDVFEVVSTAGDTFLGGDDFDAALVEHLHYELGRVAQADLREDPTVRARLRDAAENAKIALSTTDSVEVRVPSAARLSDGRVVALNTHLDRTILKRLTWSLVERTLDVCKDALGQAGLGQAQIDQVLLCGGMTRAPYIHEAVSLFFHQDVKAKINPDEAVAIGAAIQAHNLTSYEAEIDSVLMDVTPQSLGIRTLGGFTDVIISRNTPVPTEATKIFNSAHDNQSEVRIQVVQGEAKMAAENNLLGEFVLDGLRPGPRGSVRIQIGFAIDSDGIVHVSGKDLGTGKSHEIRIEGGTQLSMDELEELKLDEIEA